MWNNGFTFEKRGTIVRWSGGLRRFLGVVRRSIEKTCRCAWDTWDRVGLGYWPSVRWPIPGTCCTDNGNGLGLFSCSRGGSVRQRVASRRSLHWLRRSHNTWWRIWKRGTGNTPRYYRRGFAHSRIAWAPNNAGRCDLVFFSWSKNWSGLNSSNTCTSVNSPLSSTSGGTFTRLFFLNLSSPTNDISPPWMAGGCESMSKKKS